MKKLIFKNLCILMTFLSPIFSSAQTTTIPFSGIGLLTANSWTTHSGITGQLSSLETSSDLGNSLSYTGLPASTNNRTSIVAGNSEDVNYAISTITNVGSVYYSALIKLPNITGQAANTTTGNYFMHLTDTSGTVVTTGYVGRLFVRAGATANTFNIGVLNNSTGVPTSANIYGATPVDYAINTTYLVVVKYTYSTNTASLWVNPTVSSTEPAALFSTNFGTSAAPIKSKGICIRQSGTATAGTGNIEIDEIRVANNWSDVLGLSSSSASLPIYVPTTGLVGFWPFSGNANDASGNGNNGTINGATLTTDKSGNLNSAFSFDGINDYIQTANPGPTGTGMSVSFWMKSPQRIQNTNILEYGGNQWGSYFNVAFNDWAGSNSCYGITFEVGGALISRGNSTGLDSNIWHHCVLILPTNAASLNAVNFYIDGNLLSGVCSYANYGAPAPSISSLNQIRIGRGWQRDGYYKGLLDDIGIWNRALTQSEITALYNQAPTSVLPSNIPTAGLVAYYPFNGNANDASGNNNNGIVNGATLTTDKSGNLNSAYSFTGTETITGNCSNYPALNSSRTISLWYNANNITSATTQIMGYGGGTCGESWIMNFNNYDIPSGRYEVQGHCLAFRNHTASPTPLNNTWHNIVVSYDGTVLRFYNDGTLVKTSSSTSLNTIVNAKIFCIGKQVYSDGLTAYIDAAWPGFSGKLDDIGIWNRALTQSEITALYNTPTASASDSLWVINKQTDTLVFPSQVKLSLKSNNITSKNISAYDIKLNYDASKLKFDSVTKTNTASANGSVIVNSATTGQVIIGWASSSSISSATLPLLNCFFTPIDSGKTTVSISNAIFNTDTVKNRYSKSVINKFNFGDVDMNKIIQSYDASLVLKYSVGIDPLPNIDPLPWEPWRIKIASVDTTIAVNANDASLILKYSVGIITKFPKRGIASAPGYVTVNLENNELVVRSFEDMGGLNITFLDHLSDLGAPTFVHNTNALSAFNKQANMYKIGVAFSEAPINGTVILRIPYTGLGNQTLNMELVENTAARNYQLNVVTGINDIKIANIKIYPNPTNNIINIEGLNKNENNTIQIFDVQGKLVITKTINGKGTIDLSELNKGVYVIKIGEVAQRIVKI